MRQRDIGIEGILSTDVDRAWPICEPWINAAMANGNTLMSSESIRKAISRADLQLWVVFVGSEPVAAFVTEIAVLDYGKGLHVVACGGSDMSTWLYAVEDTLRGFAADKGCDYIQLTGRRGWLREMKSYGWRETSISMRKEV